MRKQHYAVAFGYGVNEVIRSANAYTAEEASLSAFGIKGARVIAQSPSYVDLQRAVRQYIFDPTGKLSIEGINLGCVTVRCYEGKHADCRGQYTTDSGKYRDCRCPCHKRTTP